MTTHTDKDVSKTSDLAIIHHTFHCGVTDLHAALCSVSFARATDCDLELITYRCPHASGVVATLCMQES
eukprot:21233-Heterococcus_DN1.PRE.4